MSEADARNASLRLGEALLGASLAKPWRGRLALPTAKSHSERNNKAGSCRRGLRIGMSRWVGRRRRHR